MRVNYRRGYKGFDIEPKATELPQGGYVASVTLTHEHAGRRPAEFQLPFDDTLETEDEALQQAMQYGLDLVDGFVSGFDPERITDATNPATSS